ncbi:MAG: UvrD-helicase domain-containing protein [Wolbachia endosymbiont of Tyrophagus putrescentiae]|nr:UvrD-helicase domain-containing protein [Wolbachia endosymbiont of Tyrophagus putrescentiae]
MRKDTINPNFSVWVNASAGAGKTKILIDRVLRLLLDGKKNILCLTFTNAAANEMENRIYSTLSKWALCSDNELTADPEQLFSSKIRARKLFSELENLNLTVQTIHAFCYRLISNYPIEAGVPPNCKLSECKELHSIVFNKVLNCDAIQDNINVIAAEIDENELRDLLYTLCSRRSTRNVKYIKDKLNAPDEIHDLPGETHELIKKLAEILSQGSKRDQNYSKNCTSNIESLVKVFMKSESYETKDISSIVTKGTLEKFPEVEQIINDIQSTILSYVRDMESYQIFQRTSNLLNILEVYIDFYNSEKLKNALLDYNDIIDLTTNLLDDHDNKDWVLYNLDQKIDHILVDEAQDNSLSQWKIITSLCDEFFSGSGEKRTLFVVGDVKQSIYRFQGANPILFNYMRQYFHEKTEGRNWLSCKLEKSFRSTPEILTLVDRLFGNFREEVSFGDEEIKHIPHRENDRGYIEIWPLLPKCKETHEQQAFQVHFISDENYIADRSLAQTVAHKIYNWLNDGRILVAKDRHVEPRDIMVLVRQRNVLVDYIVSELKKANIPVIGRDYFRIMDNIVAQDLVALAEFLLLPANDLALASVLKSPLFSFTEEDLFNIAYDRKEHSLWERLHDYSESIYDELSNLIDLSKKESPLALFTHILSTGKKKFAARLGLECFEVIDEFMSLVLQFYPPSLQAFVQWIKENNPEVKNNLQSDRNAVKIMTIHKSKGLQAPIVFLVDTNTVPRNNESIVFDEVGAPFWCRKNNNAYCNQIKKEKKIEDYNEYLRLLYVALTRAEDELYILGKEPMQKNSWYDLITTYGEPYERKQQSIYPMFKEEVEVLCINSNYPYIYKKRDYFNIPVISLPENLSNETVEVGSKKEEKGFTRGKIIHSILQYMPKIEKERRKTWVKKYLESVNIDEDKNEIYDKVLAFNEKYGYLFDLEGKSELTLSGMVDNETILVRLDRLCITPDKIIIIDYKSHRTTSITLLDEIEKQMLTYKTLVKEIYPDKQIECLVIWVEDLTTTYFCSGINFQ